MKRVDLDQITVDVRRQALGTSWQFECGKLGEVRARQGRCRELSKDEGKAGRARGREGSRFQQWPPSRLACLCPVRHAVLFHTNICSASYQQQLLQTCVVTLQCHRTIPSFAVMWPCPLSRRPTCCWLALLCCRLSLLGNCSGCSSGSTDTIQYVIHNPTPTEHPPTSRTMLHIAMCVNAAYSVLATLAGGCCRCKSCRELATASVLDSSGGGCAACNSRRNELLLTCPCSLQDAVLPSSIVFIMGCTLVKCAVSPGPRFLAAAGGSGVSSSSSPSSDSSLLSAAAASASAASAVQQAKNRKCGQMPQILLPRSRS